MGIILGALGGAGEALQKVGAANQDAQLKQDQTTLESNLAQQRAEALEVFKTNLTVNTENQQREAQNARIGTAQQGIVGNAIAAKYAGSDAAVAAAAGGASPEVSAAPGNDDVQAALTPEQQAVIDQSKAADTAKLMADPSTRTQAAIQTGDIAPKDAMNNTSKLEINQLKMDNLLARANDRNATQQQVADVRAEALKYGYELRLQAAQEKQMNGKIDTATQRMLITSLDTDIRASTSQLNMLSRQLTDTPATGRDGKPNPVYQDLQTQISGLRDDITSSKKQKAAFFSDAGITAPAPAAAPAPAPATPAGAPGAPARPPLSNFLK